MVEEFDLWCVQEKAQMCDPVAEALLDPGLLKDVNWLAYFMEWNGNQRENNITGAQKKVGFFH